MLKSPVQMNHSTAVRKLMEASGPEGDLLSDGDKVYGLGVLKEDYESASEKIFLVTIMERGVWELSHAEKPLLTVRDGIGRLPRLPSNKEKFSDVVSRIIPEADIPKLESLAEAAGRNEYGAMLVISSNAEAEARRLSPQAWKITSAELPSVLLTQLTDMDGGVLVDVKGRCHAIGVILDGIDQGIGDPSRGSRFTNAIRYIDNDNAPPAVVVVYSTDGKIDILPDLMPMMDKQVVESTVADFLDIADSDDPDFAMVNFYWNKPKKIEFYLSSEQCEVANTAYKHIDQIIKNKTVIRTIERNLSPNPKMNESYCKRVWQIDSLSRRDGR